MKQDILIGCVADDFTGASDAASFLMSKGMKPFCSMENPMGKSPLPGSCHCSEEQNTGNKKRCGRQHGCFYLAERTRRTTFVFQILLHI